MLFSTIMLNKIIEFSVRNKLIIGLFILALVGYGAYETTRLPIDAVPDITNNQVQVITVAPSFGATDIERLVTFPIEQANSNIAGMKEIRSFSRFGLSLVTIVFEDNVDVYWARQQVAERLQQVQSQIPQGIGTPELGPISTGLGEIYQYVVRAKKGYEKRYDITRLRTIQDWIVRRQLLDVKGVAEVSSFGGKLKQYEVAINPDKLNAYGITINDVFKALEDNNQNTGGAYIEKGPTVLYIRSEGLVGTIEDIGNVALENKQGMPVFLRDIAEIKTGYATRYGALTYNDEGEVAGAIVMMLKGANSSEVIKNVKERITQIEKTLPEGVEIEPFLDRTKMVNNAIGTVEHNLMEGALIVVFVLVVFLGNFRAGLLVASVIPLAMLFAICMMNLFGVSGNLMSLGALDFGLIVDGAVIIVEAVMHKLHHSKKLAKAGKLSQNKMDSVVTSSAEKMMNSAVFGQIIILIVYLPIFTLEGIEGKMFKPMAQTVAFALLGAFILSLTYIPMMSALFLSRKTAHSENISDKVMAKIEAAYQGALLKLLHHQKKILATVALLFVAAVGVMLSLGGEFIPSLEEGDFAVESRVLTGSNLQTTIETTSKAAGILKQRFPEVIKVVTKIGSGEVPTDPMPMEAADMMIILKDKSEWTTAKTTAELTGKMSKALEDVPGRTAGFQFPVQMRFNELMTGARQDVVLKVFGENLDSLANTAAKLGKIINTVDGATALYIEPVTGMQQVVINYNRALMAQYHLSVADVNRVVNTAFAGQSAGLVFEEEKRFDIVVRLDADKRKNLDDIRNVLVPTQNGVQVPLSLLADVKLVHGPNQIQREDAKRRIVVGFNVSGRDVQSIVEELQAKVDKQLKLPTGYYVTYGGAFENLNQAKARLSIAVPISLALIFVLLFFAFRSVKQGLIIYTAIPLSAIGGVFFLALRGMPFSISAGVGFIALFGVAVLNGIVLISEFNRLKQSGLTNIVQIIKTGTRSRLRPVLMTAFVASLGFLPMAISNGAGAEVQRPLATVVIGGLMVATFLTLFVLPMLYILSEKGFRVRKGTGMTTLIALILLTGFSASAQEKITLNDALNRAVANNNQVKSERLKAQYREALTATGTDIQKTALTGEYGQINSIYNDTKFGVSQTISFPTVYNRQKKLLGEEYKAALLSASLKVFEIKKAVTQVFYTYTYLYEKEQLLLRADSLYSGFAQKAKLRLKSGETNVLEEATAENQRAMVAMQLLQLRRQLQTTALEFQLLLNSDAPVIPLLSDKKTVASFLGKSVDNSPYLKYLGYQKNIAAAQTEVERAKLLPDITFGYANMSIKGTGANDVFYGYGTRFSAVQFGLQVPIFLGHQRARIKAAKLSESIAQADYVTEQQKLQSKQAQLMAAYNSGTDATRYYEEKGLKNAGVMRRAAVRQFESGEINFLDFVLLANQSITIENDYVEALKSLNDIIIELNFIAEN